MGILDIFTGDPAKEAAAKNAALLQANQTNGTSVLNNNLTAGTGILNANQVNGTNALTANQTAGTGILENNQATSLAALKDNLASGTGVLRGGQDAAIGALDSSKGDFAPLLAKYGASSGLYLDSLGVNGPEGNTRATGAFHAGPGYRYAVDQSLDGINRHAAAAGVAAGGNTLAALSDRAGNLADQEYGNWQTRLSGTINPELAAASGMSAADAAKAGIYRGTAGDIANLGTNTANGIVGVGGATARGLADLGTHTADSIVGLDTNTANRIADLGTGTANNIVGLNTSTTNGITGQNTQAADAEMQGSGNLWGLGLNLAKLGVGAFTGGTSLLGGGGGQTTRNPYNTMARAGLDF